MRITQLSVENFRNLAAVELKPAAGINIIVGDNAAGKTSLLEAIHFLAQARSFRPTRPQQLIRYGAEALTVRGLLAADPDAAPTRLTIRRGADRTEVRIDGRDVRSLSALARHLPLQVVSSESQRLLLDGPQVRRSFVDWGVFHVEHTYYDHWRRYDRALRQRNRALRAGDTRLAQAWEPELVAQAESVTEQRRHYIGLLATAARPLLARWLPTEEVTLGYRPGWPADRTLAESLQSARARECEAGYSLYGPHRADLLVRAGGHDAQHRLSRGQQKLLITALLLASSQAMNPRGSAVLLIDDLPAELDAQRRSDVMDVLVEAGAQAFVTATDPGAVPLRPDQAAWFHVEHGWYTQVV